MYESYIKTYLEETAKIAQQLAEENVADIENIIEIVKGVKENKGNIFFYWCRWWLRHWVTRKERLQ